MRYGARQSWWGLVPFAIGSAACAVPWLFAHTPELALALQRGFSMVCHQQADRSYVMFGGTVAVCARCLGIYLGAAVGLLLRVERRVAMRFLIVSVMANAADRLAESAGWHGNWMLVRFALGIALGAALAMIVGASLERRTQAKPA